jgi:hypothetical protein
MTHCFPSRWEFGKIRNQPSKLSRPENTAYRVGEPFRRGRREWPEGAQLVFGSGGPELTVFHREIGDDLVDDVRRGPAEFALIVELPLIVLAYRLGESIPWNNVPYSWHLQPEQRRVIPSELHAIDERSLLWITLVGATDGIIHAQRGLTLSPDFTQSLHEAIHAQAMTAFEAIECAAAISSIYLRKMPMVDLLAMAKTRTMGNA